MSLKGLPQSTQPPLRHGCERVTNNKYQCGISFRHHFGSCTNNNCPRRDNTLKGNRYRRMPCLSYALLTGFPPSRKHTHNSNIYSYCCAKMCLNARRSLNNHVKQPFLKRITKTTFYRAIIIKWIIENIHIELIW